MGQNRTSLILPTFVKISVTLKSDKMNIDNIDVCTKCLWLLTMAKTGHQLSVSTADDTTAIWTLFRHVMRELPKLAWPKPRWPKMVRPKLVLAKIDQIRMAKTGFAIVGLFCQILAKTLPRYHEVGIAIIVGEMIY